MKSKTVLVSLVLVVVITSRIQAQTTLTVGPAVVKLGANPKNKVIQVQGKFTIDAFHSFGTITMSVKDPSGNDVGVVDSIVARQKSPIRGANKMS